MASNLRVDTILPSTGSNVAIGTASGSVSFVGDTNITTNGSITVGGNLGIGGTLTYEDVTNIDSVGIITARTGIRVTNTTDGIAVGTNAMVSGRGDNVLHLHKASGGTADGPTIYFTNQQTGVTGNDGLTIGLNDSQSPYIWNRENTALRFGTNNAERARITATGSMGLGTNNPSDTLHVYHATDNYVARFESGDAGGGIALKDNTHTSTILTSNGAFSIDVDNGGDVSGETIAFKMSGSEKVRINSDGDLLVRRTATIDASEVLGLKGPDSEACTFGITSDGTTQAGIIAFNDDDANFRGRIQYQHNDDSMHFRTASTERLRIDASGALTVSSTTDGCLNLDTSDSRGSFIRFKQGGSSQAFVGCGNGLGLGNTNTLAFRSDADIRIRTGAEEHVHIKADGLAAFKGAAGNWIYSNHPSNYHFHQFSSSRNGEWMMQFRQEHHNGLGFNMRVNNNNNNEAIAVYRENQSNYGFKVYNTGNVSNINNSYGSLSDVSLKENIVNASSQWNDIKAVKVRNFNLKSDADNSKMIGVVAQELETVSPKLVFEDKEGMKGVHYSVLYMKAIKALQESQTRIETLESKVAALEGS